MDLKELQLTPRRLAILKALDISDVEGLLRYYPYRYEENVTKAFKEWQKGDNLLFEGRLLSYPGTYRFGKIAITRFKVLYDEEVINVTIFNRPWIKNLKENATLVIKGRYDGQNNFTALNYTTHSLNEELGIKAVYSLKEGMRQSDIAKMVDKALKTAIIKDNLPQEFIERHGLISLEEAYRNIHFPTSRRALKKAIVRLKYDEFLRFYLVLESRRQVSLTPKEVKDFSMDKMATVIKNLPFELTLEQKKALGEILEDLKKPLTMTRLLQGDVGSGKTIIAALALYANSLSSYMGAFMAPTSVLAKQHYQSLCKLFPDLNIALLCGNKKDNGDIKKAIGEGKYDIVVGTHALFSDDVYYPNLGLVVTDEQQRFGVKQRHKLKNKGQNVDLLMMSATPIPRTLAASIYGDMEVSTIEGLPMGRKGCDTYLIKENSIVSIIDEIKEALKAQRQVYFIAAAINKSEALNVKDAVHLYAALKDLFKTYRLGLLHGQMSEEEKDKVMEAFLNGDINILVATTVVEVGVNVVNATMMIVYDADRFGLSQLHQLRGRIQRGYERGKCFLLTANKDAEALKRLKVLEKSNDGFYIAQEDLKLRGPGDIIGTRQSGLPSFILGDIMNDTLIVEAAKKDAREILERRDEKVMDEYYREIDDKTILNAGD